MSEEVQETKEVQKEFKVNSKKVDYNRLTRITIGDIEDLEESGVSIEKLSDESSALKFGEAINLIYHFSNKVNNKVSREDVRSIGPEELSNHVTAILIQIGEGQDKADPPS